MHVRQQAELSFLGEVLRLNTGRTGLFVDEEIYAVDVIKA